MHFNNPILWKSLECNETESELCGIDLDDEIWQAILVVPHKNPQKPLGPPII